MLSALAVCAGITAIVAGIAGAWSPCGFSMVDTIGGALGDARRSATLTACATFTLGAVIGGAVTFGGLGALGALIGHNGDPVREALGAAIALAAAIADWRGVRIAPQIRRQVPERWRWTLPLPVACALYGILLGLGFTTFVLAYAVWALAGVSVAAASPMLGLLVGVGFGVGRALPVLWMAPGLTWGDGARRLDRMAADPRLWVGLRRVDAIGLGLCTLFLTGATATAAVLPTATDPSAAGEELAWQQVNGPGMLHTQAGQILTLPGIDPAIGQTAIAWQSSGQITVADRASLAPRVTFAAANVNALAVSDSWVVYRDRRADGGESLVAVALPATGERRYLAGAGLAGELGRPALDDSTVVFAVTTPNRSTIETIDLATGARHVARHTEGGSVLENPSLLSGRLLYVRVDRCAQELRIGSARAPRDDRVLLRLASTVRRDPGYQPGYEHAYNGASVCHNRSSGQDPKTRLGPTALSAAAAYVTQTPSNPAQAHILTIPR
jgi:hypothetical protein